MKLQKILAESLLVGHLEKTLDHIANHSDYRLPMAWRCRRVAQVFVCLALLLLFPVQAITATLDLSLHEGKVVVVDFWASWCVPCRRSFPWLNAMWEKYADQGLVIVGVNLDNKVEDAHQFLKEYPAQFDVVYDSDKSLAKEYDVVAMPSSFLIGRDGEVRAAHLGFKVKLQDEYEAAIVEALRQEH